MSKYTFFISLLLLSCADSVRVDKSSFESISTTSILQAEKFIFYKANPKIQNLDFYWKNENNEIYGDFNALQLDLEKQNKELIFAMNGGMYLKDQSPQGLYIENGILKSKLDTVQEAYGNFYMQPNGVFYITNQNEVFIKKSVDFESSSSIKYATQSGPLLVIDGEMHHRFIKDSENLHIRNGVGILPSGEILFAMSKTEVNFYDFATFFIENGCENALYLDGFVSRTYLPSKDWIQLDGQFGVIIGVTKEH